MNKGQNNTSLVPILPGQSVYMYMCMYMYMYVYSRKKELIEEGRKIR